MIGGARGHGVNEPREKPWLIKTYANGTEEWSRLSSKPNKAYLGRGNAVDQTTDGGFVFIGNGALNSDSWIKLTKLNATGGEEWNVTYENGIGFSTGIPFSLMMYSIAL